MLVWAVLAASVMGVVLVSPAQTAVQAGTPLAWGNNDVGQTDVPSGLTDVVDVDGGLYHSLALKSDGTVVAWGNNQYGQTDVPSGLTGVVDMAAGNFHSLAVKQVEQAYDFTGFFSPVDNPEVATNKAKAGSAIPVKFSLGGDQGLDIFESGYPKSGTMPCDSTDSVDAIEQTVTAGSSSLSYDATTDTYTYVWKTNKAWAKTCRQLMVKLNDGTTEYVANFEFVK